MTPQKGLGDLKYYLPHGYATQFASRYHCSTSKVYKVVSGKLVDYRLLKALKETALENYSVTQDIIKTNKKICHAKSI